MVSNVVPDLLMDALTGIILGVLTNINVVDASVFVRVMTVFEFVMPRPLEGFRN